MQTLLTQQGSHPTDLSVEWCLKKTATTTPASISFCLQQSRFSCKILKMIGIIRGKKNLTTQLEMCLKKIQEILTDRRSEDNCYNVSVPPILQIKS